MTAYSHNPLRKRIAFTLSLLVLSCTIGTVGYMLIEDYRFIEAIYMTIITLSTVGFQEARALSDSGRIFTSVFILGNLGVFTYTLSSLSQLLFNGEVKNEYRKFMLNKKLKKLKNHTIVCGLGRNGRQACKELHRENISFVAIEREEIDHALFDFPIQQIVGDARQDHILEEAFVQNAAAIITTLPDDAANVFVVITARHMNPNLHIISRATNDSSEQKLRRAGANNVIMPDKVGGNHMAQLVTKPDVMEFMDMISGQRDSEFRVAELSVASMNEDFANTTISELDIRGKTGANIIGFKTSNGHYVINPQANEKMTENCKLIVLGTYEQIEKLEKFYQR